MATAWIVDDDHAIRWVLERTLKTKKISYASFPDAERLWEQLQIEQPEVIISDIRMPGQDGLALMQRIHQKFPSLPIIIMTAHSDLDSAVSAYQSGAFEYLPKPFDIHEASTMIQRAISHSLELKQKRAQPEIPLHTPEIIGEAPAMQDVFRVIGRLSRSSMNVLINGQSGTGKELVAHALHKHSPRSQQTFIALNMAAIPRELIEAELFGHEKGAFTGAVNSRKGRFEQADGGTLFLDEIGDMPLDVQTRLLRVLSDGQFYRVGGAQAIQVDVRIIAATHHNLEEKVKNGDFREDLFHRLNVIRLQLPALHERREDIPLLSQHFLQQIALELKVEQKKISNACQKHLQGLLWPGNVRQLENLCRWLTVMASGQEIHINDLPLEISAQTADMPSDTPQWQKNLVQWTLAALQNGQQDLLSEALPQLEKLMLQTTLSFTHGKKLEAAKRLGWGRNTLTRKLKEFNL
ncbi:Fis family nitrogen metabolism transcriptional regulator NtrC [Psychromonas sp. CNPT3]|uniref:nitrogen regulation protein NR(I) n=1 Tax=Psychromonas sp. CNPT3 TaxID=314282 RepID=UPI00006E9CBF|nr:nitrogen regulation protein NR(I) [Psychromonas sp. CNPT3]AGH80189.1 Fis family nitrogen metabolism transcriptional regulator NtrC [Psychromonas sp. CNPT3]